MLTLFRRFFDRRSQKDNSQDAAESSCVESHAAHTPDRHGTNAVTDSSAPSTDAFPPDKEKTGSIAKDSDVCEEARNEGPWYLPESDAPYQKIDSGIRSGYDIVSHNPVNDRIKAIRRAPIKKDIVHQNHTHTQTVDIVDYDAGTTIATAFLRGIGHEFKGLPCQDYVAYKLTDDYLVAAIADGVSGSSQSHYGAATACEAAVAEAVSQLTSKAMQEIDWNHVLDHVREVLCQSGVEVSNVPSSSSPDTIMKGLVESVGTTCEVLVVNMRGIDKEFVRATLAGDGYAFVFDARKGIRALGSTKEIGDGRVSNSVRALPQEQPNNYPLVFSGILCQGQVLMLTTDGIGDDMINHHKEIADSDVASYLWHRLLSPVPSYELIRVLGYLCRSSSDDRSVVIVWA